MISAPFRNHSENDLIIFQEAKSILTIINIPDASIGEIPVVSILNALLAVIVFNNIFQFLQNP